MASDTKLYWHANETVSEMPCTDPWCKCNLPKPKPKCRHLDVFRYDQDMGICSCGFVTNKQFYTGPVDENGYAINKGFL